MVKYKKNQVGKQALVPYQQTQIRKTTAMCLTSIYKIFLKLLVVSPRMVQNTDHISSLVTYFQLIGSLSHNIGSLNYNISYIIITHAYCYNRILANNLTLTA